MLDSPWEEVGWLVWALKSLKEETCIIETDVEPGMISFILLGHF